MIDFSGPLSLLKLALPRRMLNCSTKDTEGNDEGSNSRFMCRCGPSVGFNEASVLLRSIRRMRPGRPFRLFAMPESRINPSCVVRVVGAKWVHREQFSVKLVPGLFGSCVMTPLCHRTFSSPQIPNRMVLLTFAGAIPTEPSKVATFNPVRSYVISLGAQASNPLRTFFPFTSHLLRICRDREWSNAWNGWPS